MPTVVSSFLVCRSRSDRREEEEEAVDETAATTSSVLIIEKFRNYETSIQIVIDSRLDKIYRHITG